MGLFLWRFIMSRSTHIAEKLGISSVSPEPGIVQRGMLGLLLEQSYPTGEFVRVAVTYLD